MTVTDLSVLTQPDPVDVNKPNDDDMRLWSVTTIIGVLKSEGITYWACEQAAAAAVAIAGSLSQRIKEDGEETVVKWLRDARYRKPRDTLSATALGTIAHRCFEWWALSGNRPSLSQIHELVVAEGGPKFTGTYNEAAVVDRMLDQFDKGWLQKFSPSYQATEVTVFNPTFGYAGTLDAIADIDLMAFPNPEPVSRRCLIDYKTSRKSVDSQGNATGPYPETGLQLAAYRHAELAAVWRPRRVDIFRRRYYLLGPDERAMAVPVPPVDAGLCVHVTPDHCTVHAVRCDEVVHTHFLYVLECSRWVNELAGTVIGEPLEVS